MKKYFFTLVALMVATMSFSQTTLVATLSHGNDITMYYGAYALRDAYNVAVSGDVINLSGGAFQAVKIQKAVTLRGSGIDALNPTIIVNNFDIEIPTTDTGRLSIEGVRCANTVSMRGTWSNGYFLKCFFKEINCVNSSSTSIKNATFANCKIRSYSLYGESTIQFINSFVANFFNSSSDKSTASFLNCIIHIISDYPYSITRSQLINSIIWRGTYTSYSDNSIPGSSVATNCVSIGFPNLFDESPASSGCKTSTYEEMFKTYTGGYSDTETFELTDEAKTNFLGTDGKEVGLYGGVLPYTSIPSYPQITKMNVANKTTADGKLSVEIEVGAAQ